MMQAQQPSSVFMNAMPPRCTWVPAQPVLLRPVHALHHARILPPPIIRHNVSASNSQVDMFIITVALEAIANVSPEGGRDVLIQQFINSKLIQV